MFSSVMSAAICGVNCVPVRVEADVSIPGEGGSGAGENGDQKHEDQPAAQKDHG